MVYRYSRFIVNILKGVRTETIFLQYHEKELNRFESIIITDTQARIEYVNEAFVRQSGYQRNEVMGRDPRLLQSGRTPYA